MTSSPANFAPADPSAPVRVKPDRAYRTPRAWLVLLVVAIGGIAADLGSKAWAFKNVAGYPVVIERSVVLADKTWNVPQHAGMKALPWDLLDFQLVINRGAVFGIGPDSRLFFIAFTLLALGGGLFLFGHMTKGRQHLAHVAFGLVIAGGLGNLYDRLTLGVVRDFMHMLPGWHLPFGWHWRGGSPYVFPWVFNAADVMLLAGMALLMIHINRVEHRKKKAAEAELAEASGPADSSEGVSAVS